jgi:hypothetical protein
MKCPNSNYGVLDHDAPESCILHALIAALYERGAVADSRMMMLHAGCDVEALWGDLAPIVDKLERGLYASPETRDTARHRLMMAADMANGEGASDEGLIERWTANGVPEEVARHYIRRRATFAAQMIPTLEDLDDE